MDRIAAPIDRGKLRVFSLTGELDLANAPALEDAIGAADDGTRTIVLDFSETAYLDTSILAILVRKRRTLGERLQIVVPAGARVRRVFDVTDLARQLGVLESLAALEDSEA